MLKTLRPDFFKLSFLFSLTKKDTFAPDFIKWAPKNPPIAPAPRIKIFTDKYLSDLFKNLEKLSKILKKLDKWDANEIEQTIKKFLKDEELNFKDIGLPLRVVLVGFLSPIGINTIIESLGKDEVLGRIEDIIR